MSVKCITWVYEQRVGDSLAKAILAKLADNANDNGVAWPSVETLAFQLEVSARSVKRKIAFLEDAGWISRSQTRASNGGSWGRNVYRIAVPWAETGDSLAPVGSETGDSRGKRRGTPEVQRACVPFLEPSGEPLGQAPARARDEVWDALVEQFGDPTTETGKTLRGKIVRSLKATGEASAEEITARVAKWPKVFPDATLTETALEKHWHLLNGHKPNGRKAAPPCEGCGLGGGLHLEGCELHVAV